MRMRDYPHQMSGGMRQRIVGAIALAGGPKLIIADEPTTNLDVTIQAQYLDLLKDLQEDTGVAIIFVTHNLGIVAKMCDKMAVMYAGKIVEQASVRNLFDAPKHPYTRALLGSRRSSAAKRRSMHSWTATEPRALADRVCLSSALCGCHAAVRATGTAGHAFGPEWTARCWCAAQAMQEAYD